MGSRCRWRRTASRTIVADADGSGGAGEHDRGEHGPGAWDEQHAECQAQAEAAAALAGVELGDACERLLQEFFERGKMSPTPITVRATMPIHRIASCGRCSSESSADPARVTTLKLSTRPAITRNGRSVSDTERLVSIAVAVPPAPPLSASGLRATGLSAGEEDHRQHRQDAGRDAGDQAAEETDDCEGEHDRYSDPECIEPRKVRSRHRPVITRRER